MRHSSEKSSVETTWRERISPDHRFASKDRLDPDNLVARTGLGKAPAPALDSVRSIPVDRVVRAEGTFHRATRIDLSSALPAVCSLAANCNHVLRSAKSAGTLRAAEHQPSEILAVQRPTPEAERRAAVEVLCLDTAEPCWAPER